MDAFELKVQAPKHVSLKMVAYLEDGTITNVYPNPKEMKFSAEVQQKQHKEKCAQQALEGRVVHLGGKVESFEKAQINKGDECVKPPTPLQECAPNPTDNLLWTCVVPTSSQRCPDLGEKCAKPALAKKIADLEANNKILINSIASLIAELTKRSNEDPIVSRCSQQYLEKRVVELEDKVKRLKEREAKLSAKLVDETIKVTGLQQELEKEKCENKQALTEKDSKLITELNEKIMEITILKEQLEKEKGGLRDEKSKIVVLEDQHIKEKANPKVFFDVSIDGSHAGRILMELFADVVPKTAENFRALCTGAKKGHSDEPLHYKGSSFRFADSDKVCIGGYKENVPISAGFPKENLVMKTGPGKISMRNIGQNSCGSGFLIYMKKVENHDGSNVVFGQVVEGMDVVRAIEKVGSNSNWILSKKVVIEDCGQLF